MPIIKSAIKRVRQTETRRKRNVIAKDRYKELIKQFIELVSKGKSAEAQKLYPQVQKAIDMATKKNLLHKNNAARKKSALAKMLGQKSAAKKVSEKEESPPAKDAEVKESKA